MSEGSASVNWGLQPGVGLFSWYRNPLLGALCEMALFVLKNKYYREGLVYVVQTLGMQLIIKLVIQHSQRPTFFSYLKRITTRLIHFIYGNIPCDIFYSRWYHTDCFILARRILEWFPSVRFMPGFLSLKENDRVRNILFIPLLLHACIV